MSKIPFLSAEEVQAELNKLRDKDMRELAEKTGLSYDGMVKIRRGVVGNPGIETCRKFWPHMQAMIRRKK